METFYRGQCAVLETIACGAPLATALEGVVRLIEETAPVVCSIVLVDEDGQRIRHGAAPSLPLPYVRALEGLEIGPTAGTCGAALFHRHRVIVDDIATHPNWDSYRQLALPYGLRACWSEPIIAPEGVLGTFAMYYDQPRGPTLFEVQLVETATHLASVAILRERAIRAQALRARIFDSVVDPIFCLSVERDGSYRFLSINPAFLSATGLAEGQVLGRDVRTVIPEPSCTLVLARYKEAIATRRAVRWEEVTRSPTGVRHGEVTVHPLSDAYGHCTTLVGNVHDITALREGEATRRELEAQLQRHHRLQALGTLASGIAHDFNRVLAAIASHADLALDSPDPGASLREIQRATGRATALIRQILTYGRDEPPRIVRADLGEIVDEVLALVRPSLAPNIEIASRRGPGTPVTFLDPAQVHQAVMNVVSNAAHAVRDVAPGVARIDVTIGEAEEVPDDLAPGRYVRVAVSDTGRGMDAATLARVFDPFFTTKPASEGTGLGLSIVHRVMRSHDGTATATSTLDEGTTFTLYFPVRDEPSTAPLPRGEHVMLVDDEEAIVLLAARLLTRLGFRVTSHANPSAALEAFRREPERFAAVISDIAMPGMSGVTLLAEMRRIRPDVAVILTSGHVRQADIEAAQRLGLGEPVLKPSTVEEFAWLISNRLKGRGTLA
jgi:two-component system, cell cycle sensor histidine kinase and response regulator CckA